MRRTLLLLAALVAAGAGYWLLTMPRGLPQSALAALPEGDPQHGETVFWAAGCASCHAEARAKGEERLRLGGGQVLETDFGDFSVPNISPDSADGIGSWSLGDFANAIQRGISPDGRHYYPAFPYASYIRMRPQDVSDLWAYLQTLPPVSGRAPPHHLAFPYNLRRGLGLWKLAFLTSAPAVVLAAGDPQLDRGQYLVEALGHCGECHTPRNFAGAMDTGRWLGGAPAAEGDGRVPNITTGGGTADWSAGDLAYYFESGFTPDFDTVGGAMVEVQANLAMLQAGDREAIAGYLKAIPPVGPPTGP